MVPISPSRLRDDVYRILDEVLATGIPVEILRNGRLLRIVQVEEIPSSKLSRLDPHPHAVIGDPESILDIDWSDDRRL